MPMNFSYNICREPISELIHRQASLVLDRGLGKLASRALLWQPYQPQEFLTSETYGLSGSIDSWILKDRSSALETPQYD